MYFIYSIYLFLAMLGLHCCGTLLQLWCVDFSLQWLPLLQSTGSRACGPQQLLPVGSVVVPRLQSSGSLVAWAQFLCSMWDLPRPGIKPMSPALAVRFFTIEPPGKPYVMYFNTIKGNKSKKKRVYPSRSRYLSPCYFHSFLSVDHYLAGAILLSNSLCQLPHVIQKLMYIETSKLSLKHNSSHQCD